MEVGGGTSSRWPEIFGATDVAILSEAVIDVIIKEELTGFVANSITITKITKKKLRGQFIPKYFLLQPTGKLKLDLEEYGDDEDGYVCPKCGSWIRSAGGKQLWERRRRYVPDLKTWDGLDFVNLGNVNLEWILCTRRFVELASRNQWADFKFGGLLPGVAINHLDPNWFDEAAIKIKAKYPDLFLGEGEAKKILPPNPEIAHPPLSAPQKTKSESEEYEERVNALLNPRFDLIEAHFKHRVPQPLKELYQNREELLRWRFVVDVPVPQEILDRAGDDAEFEQISVERYEPIDGKTMENWGPSMENYVEFASDGGEGIYCIDPKESDPEVHLFIMDGGDLIPLEVPLSEFLTASRRINH